MGEERLVYAAYVGYCLRGFLPENDDELDFLFNNLGTMIKIATIAYFHEFKSKGNKISTDAMYDDGFEDAWKIYKDKFEGR